MTISTRLYTLLFGKQVGSDEIGNRYFTNATKKRWVLYKHGRDASAIPPSWHGWMHYRTDTLPTEANAQQHSWQKPYIQNLTGTDQAYFPPGHPLKGGVREKVTGDYEPWQP